MPTSLPVFLDEVPEYQIRDGRMYITMGTFCLAMPIHVYLKGAARGSRAVREWHSRRAGEIVTFPGFAGDAAAKLGAS